MNIYSLNIETVHRPKELISFFRDNEVDKGDTLKIITEEDKNSLVFAALVTIVLLALFFSWDSKNKRTNRRKKDDDVEPILSDLFKGKSIDEIEKEVESDYGIKIEVEQKENEEYKAWRALGAKNFLRVYSDDEPKYTMDDIKEPNPLYKKWKGK